MFLLVAISASQAITIPTVRGLSDIYNYPSSAMNRGDEGAAFFSASVSPDGKVYGCDLLKSSGTKALDQATCTAMRRRHADPARDVTGTPIYGVVTGWVDWTLDGHPTSTYRPGAIIVDFYVNHMPRYVPKSEVGLNLIVDEQGRIDGCYVAESSGAPELDSVACTKARSFSQLAAAKDGDGNAVRSAQSVDVIFHTGPMPSN
jgi:TonB family protein